MPIATVNGIDINYSLEGDGAQHDRAVNGLADDLTTWELQMADLLGAGYRVLRYDNRGVGVVDAARAVHEPAARRRRQGARRPPRPHRLPPDGGVDGRDDRPGVRPRLPGRPRHRDVRLHLCGARPVLLADVLDVARHGAGHNGVPFIMRDVLLWAFTVPFFEERPRTPPPSRPRWRR